MGIDCIKGMRDASCRALVGEESKAVAWSKDEVACGRLAATPERLRPVSARRGYAPEGAKRRYMAHFVSKLTDADGENSETDTWLDFAKDCGYLSSEDHAHLTRKAKEVGAMLGNMIKAPSSFITKSV